MSFSGLTNPVIAAKKFVEATGAEIDAESFDRVAAIRGDASPEQLANGFIVRGISELERLCDIGNFVIFQTNGKVTCSLPEEFEVVEDEQP